MERTADSSMIVLIATHWGSERCETVGLRSAAQDGGHRVQIAAAHVHHQSDAALGGETGGEHERDVVQFGLLPRIAACSGVGDQPRGWT